MKLPDGTFYTPPTPASLKSKKWLGVFKYDLLIKVREVNRPYGGDNNFLRIVVALPNLAGRTMSGCEIPSFRKPFLIWESSDYTYLQPPTKDEVMAIAKKYQRRFPRIGLL